MLPGMSIVHLDRIQSAAADFFCPFSLAFKKASTNPKGESSMLKRLSVSVLVIEMVFLGVPVPGWAVEKTSEGYLVESSTMSPQQVLEQKQREMAELQRIMLVQQNMDQAALSANRTLSASIAQSNQGVAQAGATIQAEAERANALGAVAANAQLSAQATSQVQASSTFVPPLPVMRSVEEQAFLQPSGGKSPIELPASLPTVGTFLDEKTRTLMNTNLASLSNGSTTTTDAFGNITTATITKTENYIRGVRVVLSAEIVVSTAYVDGVQSTARTTLGYTYDSLGQLTWTGQTHKEISYDGYGFEKTVGDMLHTFVMVAGQLRLAQSVVINPITISRVDTTDPSRGTVTGSVSYGYDSLGRLNNVTAAPTQIIHTLDGFGFIQTTAIVQDIFSVIGGQPKLTSSVVIQSHSVALDGTSTDVINASVTYTYGTGGRLTSASGSRTIISRDAFGFTTSRLYLNDTYVIIKGQARVKSSATSTDPLKVSKVTALDGSITTITAGVTYSYDGAGRLISTTDRPTKGSRTIISTDAFRFTTSTLHLNDTYVIIKGQARVKSSATSTIPSEVSQVIALDGSITTITASVTYTYGTAGRLTSARGSHTFIRTDLFGSRTTTTVTDRYTIIKYQARLRESSATVRTEGLDGIVSDTPTPSVISYTYNSVGQLTSATAGVTHVEGHDAFGFNTYVTDTTDMYTVIRGKAQLSTSATHTVITGIDGSGSVADNGTLIYGYDYIDATLKSVTAGVTHVTSHDALGTTSTESWIWDTYMVIRGQPRVVSSWVRSVTTYPDGSQVTSDSTSTYNYDSDGNLKLTP